jgi:hypothetical protein
MSLCESELHCLREEIEILKEIVFHLKQLQQNLFEVIISFLSIIIVILVLLSSLKVHYYRRLSIQQEPVAQNQKNCVY